MKRLRKVFFSVLLLLTSCSGLEQSEQENLRHNNAKGEFILRNHDEFHYAIDYPTHHIRENYPWEQAFTGKHSKITKEFFRCKGSCLNPPHVDPKDPKGPNHFDCGGPQKHSLPLREDKEFIYPILIDLLNYIQKKTESKVLITCGHRCPVHNAYVDNASQNQHSKHMIGAEVDFYVQGMEQKPQDVIHLLMQYYKETSIYLADKQYIEFQRLEKPDPLLSTSPWFNKEILIKLHKKQEGRDFDNRHPFPYITIQVRYDREINEKVICSWPKAFNQYKRY